MVEAKGQGDKGGGERRRGRGADLESSVSREWRTVRVSVSEWKGLSLQCDW